MDIRIVPLEARHARIVPHLRQADVEEIRAMTGLEPRIAVAFSIANAAPGWAVEVDGRVEAICGVGPVQAGASCAARDTSASVRVGPVTEKLGRPWLVGTDEVAKHPVMFYRMSRRIVDAMRARYSQLENWVDARNGLSIRWLKWAGFYVEEPEKMGAEGQLFHRFWMEVF